MSRGHAVESARHPPRVGVKPLGALWRGRAGYAFLTPYLIFFAVLIAYPVGAALMLAFQSWTLGSDPQWVGVANFQRLFADDLFWKVLGNTLYFVVGDGLGNLVLPLVLAIVLNLHLPFRSVFRTAFFLPVVTSWVVVSVVWATLYERVGPLNFLLTQVGLPLQPFLSSPDQAMPSIIVTSVWKNLGFYALIYLAALQGIPEELYEAARLDGANELRVHRYLTLPLLRPTIFFVLVISIVRGMQLFTQPFVMTDGGPLYSTMSVVMYLYRHAFLNYEFGYASAAALVLFVILLAITLGLRTLRLDRPIA